MAGGIHDFSDNHRLEMLKAFDETKTGVKGLLDSGVDKLPKIFVRPSEELSQELTYKSSSQFQVPVINLTNINDPINRKQIIEQVRSASETWGFFQVVNHGIPSTVLHGMINGIREFNEGDVEEKKRFYTREPGRRVGFSSNFDLYTSATANWRDTLRFSMSNEIDKEELPVSCRESVIKYSKHVVVLGNTLLKLLSEALGFEPDHLINSFECSKEHHISCHYYPACPQPELTLGSTKHSDPGFLTILLQNQISGLQILHRNEWITIEPHREAFVINIGDLLQLVTNGKFKSIQHRVVANSFGPRISVACFLSGPIQENKIYGPIKELVSEEDPAVYREVVLRDYMMRFLSTGLGKNIGLDYYKL